MLMQLFKLMRVPLVLTAMADSLTGYFITRTPAEGSYAIPPLLALLSGLLYSGGMVLNDVEDAERDRQIHPERPIPSGLVTRNQALIFAGLLLFPTILISYAISVKTLVVSMAIITLLYTYNHFLKRHRLMGSLNMGMLRFCNLALGMSVNFYVADFDSHVLLFPGFLLLYVAILTMMSTFEEGESSREGMIIMTGLQILLLLGFSVFASDSILAIVVSLALVAALGYQASRVWNQCTTETIREMILWSIMGILLVDCTIALTYQHYVLTLIFLFGFLPATWGLVKLFRHV